MVRSHTIYAPNVKDFKRKLTFAVGHGENVVAGRGYIRAKCETPDSVVVSQKHFHSLVRARHKTCKLAMAGLYSFQFGPKHLDTMLNHTTAHFIC